MRKLFKTHFILSFLILALVLFYQMSRAAILIGSMSSVTTPTTNSLTFVTNNAIITLPQISVANNGLAISNAYNGSFRWSFDNTTFFTNGSPQFNPNNTNAGTTIISAQTVSVPVYIQVLATTNSANTNPLQLGVSSP